MNALERGGELGADAVQVFTQSPRMWRPTRYTEQALADYRAAAATHPCVRATFAHATYLINLATADDVLLARSVECLTNNLSVARGLGASGLVLHVGSHHGAGTAGVLTQVATALRRALDEATPPRGGAPDCPILIENAAGSGGTVGRTFEEVEQILDAADGDRRLGLCIDTQHLWASGVDYSSVEAADAVVDEVRRRIGLERLGCLHLNDSKVPLGSNRDRHENLGAGSIGEDGLAALLGHAALEGKAALLEVPGEGKGPRASDVADARRVLSLGLRMRGRSSGSAGAATKKAATKRAATKATKKTATPATKKTATKKAAPPAAKKAATPAAKKAATKKTATKATKKSATTTPSRRRPSAKR